MGKKTKRKNRQAAKAAPAAATHPVRQFFGSSGTTCCLHGASLRTDIGFEEVVKQQRDTGTTPIESDVNFIEALKKKQCCDGTIRSLMFEVPQRVRVRDGASYAGAMAGGVGCMSTEGLLDDETIAYVVGQGVNYVLLGPREELAQVELWQLRNNMAMALQCCHLVMTMEYFIKVGHEQFVTRLRTSDDTVRRECPWWGEWNRDLMDVDTERDVVRFLAKRCPAQCRCLHNTKKGCKEDPKERSCHKCSKLVLIENLLVCSRCEVVSYCSPVCQQAHWDSHRDFCRGVALAKKAA